MKTTLLFLAILLVQSTSQAFGQEYRSWKSSFIEPVPDTTDITNKDKFAPKTVRQARAKMWRHTLIPLGAGYLLMAVGGGLDYGFENDIDGLVIPGSLLAGYGGLIGPSMGNLYAEDLERGLGGIGARFLGSTLFALGVVSFTDNLFDDIFYGENNSYSGATVLISMGIALYLGSAIYNMATTGRSVREYNARAAGVSFSLAPSVDLRTSMPILAMRINL